jgi:hypothetical protein
MANAFAPKVNSLSPGNALAGQQSELRAWNPGVMDNVRNFAMNALAPLFGGDVRAANAYYRDKVQPTLEFLPGVGDVMAAGEARDAFGQGDYLGGGLLAAGAAAGLVPGVGDAVQKGIKAAVKSRGDEVLGLLKAGRADQVTDEMLDLGNAADNANLNAYLFENYDLPMDEASRMARAQEMGFNTRRPVYHGSPDARGIKAQGFQDQTQTVMRDGGDWVSDVKKPIFTSDSRRVAATYADDNRAFDYQNAEPETLELLRRSGDDVSIDAQGARFRGLDVRDVEAGTGADMSRYRGQVRDGEMSTDGLGLVLSDQGRDGAIIRNVVDDYMGYGKPSQVQMTVNPRDLRFKSARFDPRLKHLRNLSAGVGGAAVGLNSLSSILAQQPQREEY